MSSPTELTYANIVNITTGVAPSDVPPGSRDLGRSHPDYGSGGLMKSRAQPFSATTAILNFPDQECPELYTADSPTIQVTIHSTGQPNLRGHILRQLISDQQILLLNYGRADTWYFSSITFDVTKLHNTHKTYGPYTLYFSLHQKDKINGTLRWVPPTLSDHTLIQALQPYSNKQPIINTIPHTNNRNFSIYTDSPATIPHYIQINYKNKSLNILIAIKDRKQACQTCASTSHWTNQCHVLNPETMPRNQPSTQTAAPPTPQPPMPGSHQNSPIKDIPSNPKTPPKKQPPAQKPAPLAQPAPIPSSQQANTAIEPTTPRTNTTDPTTIKSTTSKILLPDFASPLALSQNTFTFTTTPNSTNPNQNVNMSDSTSSKRKKKVSPTEEKKITKSKKLFHDFKHCRFCLEQCRSSREREKHEREIHYRCLQCGLCADKGYYPDIYTHFAENHQEETMYDCRDCNLSLPLESMRAHTSVHHKKK
jgi:hypothetical protein